MDWPDTYKMLAESRPDAATLRIAEDQLEKEVREEEDNWGPMIERYLHAANISVPAAWCAAFVNWCAEEAYGLAGLSSPLEQVPQQALVQSYYRWGKDNDRLITDPSQVGLGHLFLLYFPRKGRYAHMGFVRDPNPTGNHEEFSTVEGNTNEGGSREGYKVASRIRPYNDRYVFIDWD